MSLVGTFRKCRNVRLESGMRTKADVPDHSGFMGSRSSSAAHMKANCERDTSGTCSRRRVVICPSGGLSTGLSSLFFGFSEIFLFPLTPNQF